MRDYSTYWNTFMREYFDFLGTLPGARELLQTLKPYFRSLRYPFFYSVL